MVVLVDNNKAKEEQKWETLRKSLSIRPAT